MNPLQTFAASIRILSMDAVQKANSGHPGAPMGMADMAAVLWLKHLRVNPADTQWHNRDRFVLSNGHASMLQYAALHLTGYDLSLDDLKNFRQLHSKTPGHPEYHDTPGVELTTAPLGKEEIALTKQALGLPAGDFELPADAYQIASLREKGAKLQDEWERIWQEYQDKYPMEAQEYARVMSGKLPDGLDRIIESTLAQYNEAGGAIATRKASENAINLLAPLLPELIGGSADLTGSNLTWSKAASKSILPGDFSGNYLHYGVREFAMATIMNGLALYGGLRAYGGTFLVFSDYMRNGIRLSALMKLPVTYVLTHDSIGLGEDGSTHQPIEQIASLRLIPNLHVWRPCDQQETLVAWRSALNQTTPTVLALSRQNLPEQKRSEATRKTIAKGGYILEAAEKPDLVLVATGSEVALATAAAAKLREEGLRIQVVSMPCLDIYQQQDAHYRSQVLPKGVPTVVVEAGVTLPWRGICGDRGTVIGIDTFGESAPAAELFPLFGLTVENVVAKSKALL